MTVKRKREEEQFPPPPPPGNPMYENYGFGEQNSAVTGNPAVPTATQGQITDAGGGFMDPIVDTRDRRNIDAGYDVGAWEGLTPDERQRYIDRGGAPSVGTDTGGASADAQQRYGFAGGTLPVSRYMAPEEEDDAGMDPEDENGGGGGSPGGGGGTTTPFHPPTGPGSGPEEGDGGAPPTPPVEPEPEPEDPPPAEPEPEPETKPEPEDPGQGESIPYPYDPITEGEDFYTPPDETGETDPDGDGGPGGIWDWLENMGFSNPEYQTSDIPERDRDPEMAAALKAYALNLLSNPSRYDSDLVRQGMDVVRTRMDRIGRQRRQGAEADIARRGLTTSGLGSQIYEETNRNLQEEEDRALWEINREQANTFAADRASAFAGGMDMNRFEEGQYEYDRDEMSRSRALDLQRYGIDTNAAAQSRADALRAKMFDSESGQRERFFESESEQRRQEFETSNEIRRNEFETETEWRERQDAFEREREETRKGQWEREQQLREDGLSADEARWQADMEFRQKEADKNRVWALLTEWGFENMDVEQIRAILAQQGYDYSDFFGEDGNPIGGRDPADPTGDPPGPSGPGGPGGPGDDGGEDPYGFDGNDDEGDYKNDGDEDRSEDRRREQ